MAQFSNTKKVTYDFLSPGVSKKSEKRWRGLELPQIFFWEKNRKYLIISLAN